MHNNLCLFPEGSIHKCILQINTEHKHSEQNIRTVLGIMDMSVNKIVKAFPFKDLALQ